MRDRKRRNSKTVFHTRIPMDKVIYQGFLPDEILNQQDEKKVFLGLFIEKLVATLLSTHVSPYVVITEKRITKTQHDGIEREGILFTAILCVGQIPLIKPTNGETVEDLSEKPLVTVGNN